jgi:proline racemase
MTLIAQEFEQWQATQHKVCINTLDCHTGGEPLRIITSGWPDLQGETILAKRGNCQQNYDHLRTALMFEPRGHTDMYGALIVDAERDNSHFGAIFMHNEGYSTMCGHAVIALAKFAVESGVVKKTGKQTDVIIDVPCGQIVAQALSANENSNEIDAVNFNCVPSFVLYKNKTMNIDNIGLVNFDIAFGGAFYAYVNAKSINLSLAKSNHQQLINYGKAIKATISKNIEIRHPFEEDLSFLYGTIFYDDSFYNNAITDKSTTNIYSRNVCIFANGELDRSPTGSGVSGRIAIEHDQGNINLHQELVIESILGSKFSVKAIKTLDYAGHEAVIPQVSGNAFICGRNQWYIDNKDPLKHGFLLQD